MSQQPSASQLDPVLQNPREIAMKKPCWRGRAHAKRKRRSIVPGGGYLQAQSRATETTSVPCTDQSLAVNAVRGNHQTNGPSLRQDAIAGHVVVHHAVAVADEVP